MPTMRCSKVSASVKLHDHLPRNRQHKIDFQSQLCVFRRRHRNSEANARQTGPSDSGNRNQRQCQKWQIMATPYDSVAFRHFSHCIFRAQFNSRDIIWIYLLNNGHRGQRWVWVMAYHNADLRRQIFQKRLHKTGRHYSQYKCYTTGFQVRSNWFNWTAGNARKICMLCWRLQAESSG